MFGHGNKPPAAPKQSWALQFLTSDYLVSGLAAPEDYLIGSDNLFYEACQNQGAEAFQWLSLSSVRLEATGGLQAAAETLPSWNLGLCANLAAVIPNDEASRAAAQAAYSDYRQPLRAVFHVGPYLITGQYLADPGDKDILFRDEKSLRPVSEAQITSLAAGATLNGWRAPWLLLNARQLHGYQLL